MSEAAKKEERSLVKKLAEVMGEVERIAKNGRNQSQNYSFAQEADIAAAVREHMAVRHLILMPNVEKTEWETIGTTKSGAPRKLCTLTVKFTLMDGDSGERETFTVLGQGEDFGDKATYKAMTGATKYALMKLFLIPTGDDPENDSPVRYTPTGAPTRDEIFPPPTSAAHATATTRKADPEPKQLRVQYGSCKGQLPSELSDKDLSWYLGNADKAVKNKTKFHEKDLAWQAVLQAETARRIGPRADELTGKRSAPKTTSERRLKAAPQEDEIPPPSDEDFFPGDAQ